MRHPSDPDLVDAVLGDQIAGGREDALRRVLSHEMTLRHKAASAGARPGARHQMWSNDSSHVARAPT